MATAAREAGGVVGGTVARAEIIAGGLENAAESAQSTELMGLRESIDAAAGGDLRSLCEQIYGVPPDALAAEEIADDEYLQQLPAADFAAHVAFLRDYAGQRQPFARLHPSALQLRFRYGVEWKPLADILADLGQAAGAFPAGIRDGVFFRLLANVAIDQPLTMKLAVDIALGLPPVSREFYACLEHALRLCMAARRAAGRTVAAATGSAAERRIDRAGA
jgi:hypothetical protein